jgi:hypothetical protein
MMIEFDCPKCGAAMEFGNAMAGRRIRCGKCDQVIGIPEEDTKRSGPSKTSAAQEAPGETTRLADVDGLSDWEYVFYALVCLALPAVNVGLTSYLYFRWKDKFPKRASVINALGWFVFGIHAVLFCCLRGGFTGTPEKQ